MAAGLVTIFGGTGFIGRYVVQELAKDGWLIRVAVRRPDEALFLKSAGNIGQIVPVAANVRNIASVEAAVRGADAVINLVGILSEGWQQKFDTVHRQGAENIAASARAAGVRSLVHLSAIGADPDATSSYARSKGKGEIAVLRAFPSAVILRPSIVFGPEDNFFNRFARLARRSPVLPLIGGGHTKFQPVYVEDVAKAVAISLLLPPSDSQKQRIYELGGPRIYSFRILMDILLRQIEEKRLMLPIPFALASLIAFFVQHLPYAPLSVDQVRLLKKDNIVATGAMTLEKLGIAPTALEVILPTYLERYKQHGYYTHY